MRIRITFHILNKTEKGNILPMNYQKPISMWITQNLLSNSDIVQWLNDNNYSSKAENFNLFNFSSVIIPKYNHFEDQLEILSNDVFLHVSLFPMIIPEKFIFQAFLNKELLISDLNNSISLSCVFIEKLATPVFTDEMNFRLLSPMIMTYKDHPSIQSTEYMYPKGERFTQLLRDNLIEKYNLFYSRQNKSIDKNEVKFSLESTGKIKSRWVTFDAGTVDETKVKGFMFDFKVKGSAELCKIGFFAGFGELNSLGFGCVYVP